ncbi:MAG TPA: 1-phosphofructokinase family hexose kinase [Thermoleophilia bacterium]|nr:1-phosphofructokinase family hexose kinase [Thermoleophilia bacterium]
MIITLTANAAIDKTLTVPNFVTGFRHRASQSLTLPGGKGVNVARALKTIGQPVIVSGLVGGRTGQQIVEGLAREGILNDFVRIAGESRTSTAVIDPTSLTQTEINEWGPVVTEQERQAYLDKIEYLAKGAHYVCICGSLPRKVPDDFYAEIIQRVRGLPCITILDGNGDPLRRGLRARPGFIMPNLREAEDLVGHEFHDEQDVIDATEIICRMGAHNAIIKTPDGCYARLRHRRHTRVYHARITRLEHVVSTVGSGDAFLAGFVAGHFQNEEPGECLRYGLACGAANTQQYGAGVLDADLVDQLLETTGVEEIEVPATA